MVMLQQENYKVDSNVASTWDSMFNSRCTINVLLPFCWNVEIAMSNTQHSTNVASTLDGTFPHSISWML